MGAHHIPIPELDALPAYLARERELLPVLEEAGVPHDEIEVLRGDQQLLEILAEESQEPAAEAARAELKRVLTWHRARLERVVGDLPPS